MQTPTNQVRLDYSGQGSIRPDYLEAFAFDCADQLIETCTEEFSAVCPFSGLPDIARLNIQYHPDGGLCVELKSLKYYVVSFRNVGIYQEPATARIFDDLKRLLNTDRLRVQTIYNLRGGFKTTCTIGSIE